MNTLQFGLLIAAILIGCPVVIRLMLGRRNSPSWGGDFSLILGDGTMIPVNKTTPSDGRSAYLLPQGATLLGILLQGLPYGKMPIIMAKDSSQDDCLLVIDTQDALRPCGEVKVLLKEPWTGHGFSKKFTFSTDQSVRNPALTAWYQNTCFKHQYEFELRT